MQGQRRHYHYVIRWQFEFKDADYSPKCRENAGNNFMINLKAVIDIYIPLLLIKPRERRPRTRLTSRSYAESAGEVYYYVNNRAVLNDNWDTNRRD